VRNVGGWRTRQPVTMLEPRSRRLAALHGLPEGMPNSTQILHVVKWNSGWYNALQAGPGGLGHKPEVAPAFCMYGTNSCEGTVQEAMQQ
jgi:hypothetical protein